MPPEAELSLPFREPIDVQSLLDFLGAHAVPGVESYDGSTYTRVLAAPNGPALLAVSGGDSALRCRVRLTDDRDLGAVTSVARRLFDLDADPAAIDATLGADPALAPLVLKHPGLRSPGAPDGFEMAVRTVAGQQISVGGARTVLGRIVAERGVVAFPGEPWRLFPAAAVLAALDPQSLPMPRARARTIQALAEADLPLDPSADRTELRARLLALPGVGPWTADYLLMRVTGDPDVLLGTDLAVRNAADDLGISLADGRPDWAPWRSYATYHLWVHLYGSRWAIAA